ncbi:MAG: hypothetical protein IAG13_30305 [Deltaproteobacteria bacterium]|nr:hypothetical protein [Nannocystaceae bacterium]
MAPQRSLPSLAVVALITVACTRLAEDAAAPPNAAAQSASTGAGNPQPTVATPPMSAEATAYLADCHHRFEKTQEETEQAMTECTYREFDQNCSPDPSGCWEQGQSCRDACSAPCTSCDDRCAGGCDGCRADCAAGDDACLHACANARVQCRDACLAARDQCADKDCPAAEQACNDAHLAERAELCPKCDEIEACMNAALEADKEPRAVCERKFKREPKACFDWCHEY